MHRGPKSESRALPSAQPTCGAMAKGAFAFGAFPIPLILGQKYPAGFEVLRQGAIARDVWVIDDGVVKLVYFDEDGREVTVGVRLKGWILGSASVIFKETQSRRRIYDDALLSTTTRCGDVLGDVEWQFDTVVLVAQNVQPRGF
jgi:hypothetical protein